MESMYSCSLYRHRAEFLQHNSVTSVMGAQIIAGSCICFAALDHPPHIPSLALFDFIPEAEETSEVVSSFETVKSRQW